MSAASLLNSSILRAAEQIQIQAAKKATAIDISGDWFSRIEKKRQLHEFNATAFLAELSERSNGLDMRTEMKNKQMSLTGAKRGESLKADKFNPLIYDLPLAATVDILTTKWRWNTRHGENFQDHRGSVDVEQSCAL